MYTIYDTNLHSTMYLFQRAIKELQDRIENKFTFHYVSISTYCIVSNAKLTL